jgi:hypothetical protein
LCQPYSEVNAAIEDCAAARHLRIALLVRAEDISPALASSRPFVTPIYAAGREFTLFPPFSASTGCEVSIEAI